MKGTELAHIEQRAEQIIEGEIQHAATAEDLNELYFQLGGLDAIDAITTNLTSALIRTYQQIRDGQTYRAAGYQRFDDFLDNHPKSRMSYKRFNYIEGIYKNLGPEPFELLSGSGLSMRQMKMIGKGNVEVNGDRVIVQSDDGPIEIEIANRRQWMESLKVLADGNAEKNIKIERLKEKEAKHDEKVREIYAELDTVKASKLADIASNPHMLARVEAGLSIRRLVDAAEALSPIEKDQFRDQVLEDFAAWRNDLAHAYLTAGRGPHDSKGVSSGLVGETLDESLTNFLDNVDLDNVGNDGELADQL